MTAAMSGMSGPRTSRWMVPVLIGSVALNLIVLGAVATSLLRQQLDPQGARPAFVPRHVLSYAVTLPAERVSELEKLTEQEWQKVRPLRRALLMARKEARTALTAEPFDRQRYLQAQEKLRAADRMWREAYRALLSAIGLHLTPEERRGYLPWRARQRPPRNPLDAPERSGSGK